MSIQGTVTTFGPINYSGLLFTKGNTRTPLLSAISPRRVITNSKKFVIGQEYTIDDSGQIPQISEADSLTAPAPTYANRTQMYNITQIFHESLGISYRKESNMGELSGLNIAGQYPNPATEFDFQVARKYEKIGRQIENTFINGIFNEALSSTQVDSTRGLNQAIQTNVLNAQGQPIDIWLINNLLATMRNNGAPIDNLVLWCNTTTLNQLNADAVENNLTIVDNARDVNGIQLKRIMLPLAEVYIRLGEFIPTGTAFLLNLDVIRPVEQPVNGRNFWVEPLAKQGAGDRWQIFGQIGLDHGPEWYHGKITNLSNVFTKPSGVRVKITNTDTNPVPTKITNIDANPIPTKITNTDANPVPTKEIGGGDGGAG